MILSRTVLPNGIRILTERMPEVRSVALGFWVGVGSRDETPELQGSSHFLEHLLFKGSEKRGAREIAEAFDAVGGEANAFSAKEYTCLHGRVIDEDLPMAVDFMTDMLRNPALRADEVESERSVILEEIAMHEDTPDDLVHDLFAGALFGSHPLGRSIMGTVQTVGAATVASLRQFHDSHYRTGNLVVSAAGNVDHEELVGWIESYFPPEDSPAVKREDPAPAPRSGLRLIKKSTEQAHIVLGGPGYPRKHASRFAWGVLDGMLGGGMSSRLFQEIREKRGLVYSVYSYRTMFRETGFYGVYAGTTPRNAPEVVQLITDELDRLAAGGATEEELVRGKGQMRGGLVMAQEESTSRMSRLGKSELVQGEILSLDETLARIDAVTVEEVQAVARDLFSRDRTLTVISPLEAESFPGWELRE